MLPIPKVIQVQALFGRTGGSGTVYIAGSHGSGAGVYQWVANNPGNVNTNLVFEYKPIGYSEDSSRTDPNHYWLIGNGDAADTYFRANGEYGASGVLQIRWGGIAIY